MQPPYSTACKCKQCNRTTLINQTLRKQPRVILKLCAAFVRFSGSPPFSRFKATSYALAHKRISSSTSAILYIAQMSTLLLCWLPIQAVLWLCWWLGTRAFNSSRQDMVQRYRSSHANTARTYAGSCVDMITPTAAAITRCSTD
jgi:hypothetical protein